MDDLKIEVKTDILVPWHQVRLLKDIAQNMGKVTAVKVLKLTHAELGIKQAKDTIETIMEANWRQIDGNRKTE